MAWRVKKRLIALILVALVMRPSGWVWARATATIATSGTQDGTASRGGNTTSYAKTPGATYVEIGTSGAARPECDSEQETIGGPAAPKTYPSAPCTNGSNTIYYGFKTAYFEWTITSIPQTSRVIHDIWVTYNGKAADAGKAFKIARLTTQPSAATGADTISSEARTGTVYESGDVVAVGSNQFALNATATSDFDSARGGGATWFAVGLTTTAADTALTNNQIWAAEQAPSPYPTLNVDYTAAPSAASMNAPTPNTTSITWGWTDPNSSFSQEESISLRDGADSLVATLNPDDTSKLETGLARNTQYTRHIKVGNTANGSVNSGDISKYTLSDTPSAPTVTGPTTSSVNVDNQPAGGENAATTFAIQVDNDGDGTFNTLNQWVQSATGNLGTSADYQTDGTWGNKTVNLGTNYNKLYQVRTLSKNGDGTTSANSSITNRYTLAQTPSAPTVGSPTLTTLDVTVPVGSNPSFTTYAIQADDDQDTTAFNTSNKWVQANGTINTTPVYQTAATWGPTKTITGLATNKPYFFRAIARNGDSVDSTGADSAITYTLANVPGTPTVNGATTTSLNVTVIENGNPTNTTYAILVDSDLNGTTFDTTNYVQANGSIGGSPVYQAAATWGPTKTVTGLSVDKPYHFKLVAQNGNSVATAATASASLYTLANPPGTPTVNGATTSSLDVTVVTNGNPSNTTYAILVDNDLNGTTFDTTNYVQANGSIGASPVYQAAATWGPTKTVTGLSVDKPYHFKLIAQNGNSVATAPSASASLNTLANVPGTPTVNGATTSTLNVTVNVNGNPTNTTFAILVDNDLNGTTFDTTNYVQANGSIGASPVYQAAATWGPTKTVTGLSIDKPYHFKLIAQNGNSVATAASASASLYTLANPPGTPTVNGATTSTLDVTVNVNGNPTNTTYAILIDNDLNGTTFDTTNYVQGNGSVGASPVYQTAASWGPTKTVTGLSVDKPYHFKLIAQNGNSVATAPSASASLNTLANTPGTPTVNGATTSTLNVTVNENGNPTNTTYAIMVDNNLNGSVFDTTNYVQANGSIGASPVYQAAATWGPTKTVTGLSIDKPYHFKLIAQNGNSVATAATASASLNTLANPPGTPTVNGATTSTLNVTVNENGNPTNTTYAILVDSDLNGTVFDTTNYVQANGSIAAGIVYQTAASWGPTKTVTGLSVDKPYYFKLIAQNGNSATTASSASASLYTLANTPGTPTVDGASTATLNVAVNANGNPSNTTFSILVDNDLNTTAFDTTNYVQANGSIGASPVYQAAATWGTKTVTGLSANRPYFFRMIAQNGNSVASAAGAANAIMYTLSQVPPAATVNGATINSLNVTVNTPGGEPTTTDYAIAVDDDGNGTPFDTTNYVQTNGSRAASPAWQVASAWGTKTVTTLLVNNIYYFRVVSRNGNQVVSVAGANASLYTLSQTPAMPTVGADVGISSTTVDVAPANGSEPSATEFSIAVDDDGDGSVFNTTNYVQTNGLIGASPQWQTDAVWGVKYVTGLSSNRTYHFKSRTRNGNSVDSAFSTYASQTTYAQTPATPTLTMFVTSMTVTISPQAGESANTQYAVAFLDSGDGLLTGTTYFVWTDNTIVAPSVFQTTTTWGNPLYVLGLNVNTPHTVKLKAKNSSGIQTAYGTGTTLYSLSQVPNAPTLSNVQANSMTISVSPGAAEPTSTQFSIQVDDDGNGTPFDTTNRYVQSDGTISGTEIWRTNAQWLNLGMTGLTANKIYRFRSRSRNGDLVAGAFGTRIDKYTSSQTPQAPTISSINVTSMTVTVVPTNGEPVTTVYSIQVDDDGNGSSFDTTNRFVQANGSVNTTEVFQDTTTWGNKIVTGLSPDVIYRFRSRSQNGDSVQSTFGTSTDKYTLSQVPQAPTVSNISTSGLDVAPLGAGGEPAVTKYSIQIDDDGNGTPFDGTAKFIQVNGSIGFTEVFQTISAWGTKSITTLTPNVLTRFQSRSQNGDGTTNATFSPAVAKYTLSQAPMIPSVTPVFVTSATVDMVATSGEPTTTEYAIAVDTDGDGSAFNTTNYLQTNGTINSSAVWDTDSNWGAKIASGLTGNTFYRFKVKGRNGDLTETSYSTVRTRYTLSPVPQAVTVATIGVTSMTVNVVPGASDSTGTDYKIEVDDDGNGTSFDTTKILQLAGNLTLSDDWETDATWGTTWMTGLSVDKTYRIRVRARNGELVESSSGPAYNINTYANLPGSLAFTNVGTSSITANWTNTGSGSTQYQADHATDSGFTQNLVTSAWFVGTSTPMAGLSPATTYYFQVRARNADLVSTNPTSLGSTMTAPVGFSAATLTALYQTTATASWTDLGNGAGGKYVVELSTSGTYSNPVTATVFEPTATASISGLTANTTYYARVVAYNTLNVAATSNSPMVLSGAPAASTPMSPTSATNSLIISSEVTVSWTDPNNGPNTRYAVEISTMSNFTPMLSSATKTGVTSHLFSSLTPNTSYYTQVRVLGHNGSNTPFLASNNNPAFTNATKPGANGFTGVTRTQVTFNWNPNGNPPGTQYDSRISANSNMSSIIFTSVTANNYAAFTGLGTNTTYYCDVSVHNGSDYTTPQSTPTWAEQPDTITYGTVFETSATVNWGAASNPGGTSYYGESSGNAFSSITGTYSGTANTNVFTGLTPNTTYQFHVEAVSYSGVPTTYITATATATKASAPSATTLSAVSSGSITATWTGGSNPNGTEYMAQRATNAGFSLNYADSGWITSLNSNFGGLMPNTTYYFRVKSRNQYYSETAYSATTSTITASAPPQTTTLSAVGTATVSVDVVPDSNEPSISQFAIAIDDDDDGVPFNTTKWVQVNGSTGAAEAWQTDSAWAVRSVPNLSANRLYRFKAKSRNAANTENATFSTSVSTNTLALSPQTPTVGGQATSSLTVDVLPASGESANTLFAIAVDDDGDGSAFNVTKYVQSGGALGGSAAWQSDSVWSVKTVTGLTSNTLHRFKVKARNGDNVETTFSSTATATTLSQTPQTPTVDVVAVSSMSVNVVPAAAEPTATEYAIAVDSDGDGTIFNATNYVQTDGTIGASAQWQIDSAWGAKWVTGLANNTIYRFKAKARNADFTETGFSGVISRTANSQVPPAPQVGSGTGVGISSMTVDVQISTGDPVSTEYAIAVDDDGNGSSDFSSPKYVQTNGSVGTSTNAWQTDSVWSTKWVTGLASNTLYRFQVKSRDTSQNESAFGPETNLYTLAQAPGLPTNPSVFVTSVTVRVAAAGSEPAITTYAIAVDDDGDDTAFNTTTKYVQTNGTIGGVEAWQSTVTWGTQFVVGLSTNTTYYFKTKARNGNFAETGFSSVAEKDTLSLAPSAPTIDSLGYTTLVVNVVPAATENSATRIAIQADDDGDGSFNTVKYVQEDGTLAFLQVWHSDAEWGGKSVSGSSPLSNFRYRFRALTQNGDGVLSSTGPEVSAYTNSQPPATPTVVVGVSSASVDVGYSANEQTTTQIAIAVDTDGDTTSFNTTSYVQTNGSLGGTEAWQTDSAWGVKWVTGLSTNTWVRFKAKTRNGDNVESAFGNTVSQHTLAAVPSAPVLGSITNTSMTVDVQPGAGEPSATNFLIEVDDDGNGSSDFSTPKYLHTDGSLTFVTDWQNNATWGATAATALTPNKLYRFRVKARNEELTQTSASAESAKYTAPNAPGSAALSGIGTTGITANWTNTNSGTIEYLAVIATDSGFTQNVSSSAWSSVIGNGFTSLTPATTYFFQAIARNPDGLMSGYTSLGSTMTLPVGFSGASMANVYQTSATVSFTDLGNGTGGKYVADMATNAGFTIGLVSATVFEPSSSATLNGLTSNNTYYVRVTAYNALNVAAASGSPVTPTGTPVASNPVPPASVTFGAIQAAQIDVNWSDPTNASGSRYQVEISTMSNFSPLINNQTTTALTYNFSGLTPNTSYYARVRVNGHSGFNSGYTQAAAPAYTTGNTPFPTGWTGVTNAQATMNWNANGNPIGTNFDARISTMSNMTSVLFTSVTANAYATFTTLAPNTTHYSDVAVSGGSPSSTISTCTAANQPTGVTTPNVYVDSATVNWSANSNPSGTTYFVDASSNSFVNIAASANGTAVSATLTGLVPNTAFTFRVKAVNYAGASTSYTSSSSTQTLAASPIAGSPVSGSSTSITANWTANGNPSGTEYWVERSTASNFTGTLGNSGWITTVSHTFNGLSPNTTYYFQVKARNANQRETGFVGLPSSQTAPASPTSSAPTNVTDVSVTANWGANGNPGGTEFYAERATNSGYSTGLGNSGWITATLHNFTGLTPNTTYFMRVRARNGALVETSTVSLPTTLTLASVPTASAPSGVTASTVTANWGANGNPGATEFYAERATDSGFTANTGNSGWTTAALFNFNGLTANTTYYFRVRARNFALVETSTVALQTKATLAAAPASAAFTGVLDNAITANWTANGNAGSTQYLAERALDAGFATSVATSPWTTATNYNFTGLAANTTYYFRVRARNWEGIEAGPTSLGTKVTLVASPTALTLDSIGTTSAVLSWNVNGNPGGTNYVLEASTMANFSVLRSSLTTTSNTSIAISNLLANSTHYFQAKAVNGEGTSSPYSSSVNGMTDPVTPIATPFINIDVDRLTPTWASGGNPSGTTYQIQLDSNNGFGSPVFDQTTTGTTQLVTGLSTNATYYMRVRAVGINTTNSGWSSTLSTMTAVNGFSAVGLGTAYVSSMTITYTDNPDNPDTGAYYRVDLTTTSGQFGGTLYSATAFEPTQQATVNGLTPNTTYYARATAYNNLGLSAPAGSMTDPSGHATTPMAPAGGSYQSVSATQVVLAWTDSNNPTGTRYIAELATDSGFSTGLQTTTTNPGVLTATFNGLTSNTAYYGRVKAKGHSGTDSAYFTISGSTSTTSAQPGSPSVLAVTNGAITFGWTANGNGAGTQYDARIASDSGMTSIVATSTTLNLSNTFSGLTANTTYYLDVRSLGTPPSNYTAAISTPTRANQPQTPAGFSTVNATDATLYWDTNSNPAGTSYRVEASTTGFSSINASAVTTATPYTLSGLAPNRSHTVRVQAINHAGFSTSYQTVGTTTTLAATPTLNFFTAATNAITVNWNTNGNPNGTIYVASNDTLGAGSGQVTATSWQSTGLSVNTQYAFSVQSINSAGTAGSFNSFGQIYTLASTPLVPIGLSQSANTLRVALNPGTNPANTRFVIRVDDVTFFPTVNTYYVQTPNGSDQSTLAAGPMVWLPYSGSGGTGWNGSSGVTITGLISSRQFQVSVIARNGDNVLTAYGPTLDMTTGSGTPVISLAGHSSGDWLNTTTIGFTAAGAFHYHYDFRLNASPTPGPATPGWDGQILGGAPLSDDPSMISPVNVQYTAPLSGFHATGSGKWSLGVYGDANNTGAGAHSTGGSYGAVFEVNIDTVPPTGPIIHAKYDANDDINIITDGQATADDTPYFYWTNTNLYDVTNCPQNVVCQPGVSRIVGYSWSMSPNAADQPPMVADPSINATDPNVTVSVIPNDVYYFRVRPFDAAGNAGTVSTFVYWKTPDSIKPWHKKFKLGHDIFLPKTNMYIAVNVSASMNVWFSEAMNQTSLINGGITLTAVRDNMGNTVSVPLTVVINYNGADVDPDDGSSAPSAKVTAGGLAPGYQYEMRITSKAKDLGNNSLPEEVAYRFQTLMDSTKDNVVLSPDGKTKLKFTAGALPSNVGIAINTDPMSAPMAAPLGAAAAASLPTLINQANERARQANSFAVPIAVQEFNAYDANGSRVSGLFTGDVVLEMSYKDDDNDGVVDNTNPPIKTAALNISWLDEETGVWVRQPGSSVDTAAKTVTTHIRHFSVYGVIGAPTTDLTKAYAYPVPFEPSKGDLKITFTGLSSIAHIKIFTLSGQMVRELEEADGDGTLDWDVTNESGQPLASDVYFYAISNGVEKKTGKIVVVR